MKRIIERLFKVKLIKEVEFNHLKASVDQVASKYKEKAGSDYHNWDKKAEFNLADISCICVAENILNDL